MSSSEKAARDGPSPDLREQTVFQGGAERKEIGELSQSGARRRQDRVPEGGGAWADGREESIWGRSPRRGFVQEAPGSCPGF